MGVTDLLINFHIDLFFFSLVLFNFYLYFRSYFLIGYPLLYPIFLLLSFPEPHVFLLSIIFLIWIILEHIPSARHIKNKGLWAERTFWHGVKRWLSFPLGESAAAVNFNILQTIIYSWSPISLLLSNTDLRHSYSICLHTCTENSPSLNFRCDNCSSLLSKLSHLTSDVTITIICKVWWGFLLN